MYQIKLQWKTFKVDLPSFEAWAREEFANVCGTSGDSTFTVHVVDVDPYQVPTQDEVAQVTRTIQVPQTIQEQAVDEETGELLFDEDDQPIMVDREVMVDQEITEDVTIQVPTGEPSVAQKIQAKWDEIEEDHEWAQAAYDARKAKDAVKLQVEGLEQFCRALLVEFNTENIMLGISLEDKADDVLEVMGPVLQAIQSVSPTSAIKRAKAIPESDYDDKYVTAERLLKFVNKIEAKIGKPLSTEL